MAKIIFGGVEPFYMNIRYIETDSKSIGNVFEQHVHDECEIYFNLSGDVSFMVEDNIYPITPGSAVITRPYENHHCIYHSMPCTSTTGFCFHAAAMKNILICFSTELPGRAILLYLHRRQLKVSSRRLTNYAAEIFLNIQSNTDFLRLWIF